MTTVSTDPVSTITIGLSRFSIEQPVEKRAHYTVIIGLDIAIFTPQA
jgi:hypothetical protein